MDKIDELDKLDKMDKMDKLDKLDKLDELDELQLENFVWYGLILNGMVCYKLVKKFNVVVGGGVGVESNFSVHLYSKPQD